MLTSHDLTKHHTAFRPQIMFSSTFPNATTAEMDPSAQNAYVHSRVPHVDPIAHRPSGPFPHHLPSAIYDPQHDDDTHSSSPQAYSQAMSPEFHSATSMSGGPSYSQENSLAAAIPSSSASPHYMTPFPTSGYATTRNDRWAPYDSSLGEQNLQLVVCGSAIIIFVKGARPLYLKETTHSGLKPRASNR